MLTRLLGSAEPEGHKVRQGVQRRPWDRKWGPGAEKARSGFSAREVGSGPEEGFLTQRKESRPRRERGTWPEAMRRITKSCSCGNTSFCSHTGSGWRKSPSSRASPSAHKALAARRSRRATRLGSAAGSSRLSSAWSSGTDAPFRRRMRARAQRRTCLRRRLGGRDAAEPAPGWTRALAARRCMRRSGSRTGALRCLGQAARHLAQVAQQSGHRVAPASGQPYAAWAPRFQRHCPRKWIPQLQEAQCKP